jgi:hypothetical protein
MKTKTVVAVVVALTILAVLVVYISQTRRSCYTCKGCQKIRDGQLLPVSDAAFTMREAGKQLVLLEDHLNSPNKRCKDCITKHCALAEGLCEEVPGLDGGAKYGDCGQYSNQIRSVYDRYLFGEDPQVCAQKIRAIRKTLLGAYVIES